MSKKKASCERSRDHSKLRSKKHIKDVGSVPHERDIYVQRRTMPIVETELLCSKDLKSHSSFGERRMIGNLLEIATSMGLWMENCWYQFKTEKQARTKFSWMRIANVLDCRHLQGLPNFKILASFEVSLVQTKVLRGLPLSDKRLWLRYRTPGSRMLCESGHVRFQLTSRI